MSSCNSGAELARETAELKHALDVVLDELTGIYAGRGLTEALARQVTVQLTRKDSLGAFARDLLGITTIVAGTTLIGLMALGGLGASVGGAGIVQGAVRVTFWGAFAKIR